MRPSSRAIAALTFGALAGGAPATAAPPDGAGAQNSAADGAGGPGHPSGKDARELLRYATDTWTSMAAMAHPETGLVDDNMR
ncbi:hypothetical protein [uncultured Microbacterium sp.]|uniref:hypothetical protein n=1 Tax=uncultured Microbacterium sp. TaxID=191216 RepID=UPI0025E83F0B|nr:hypothetical protein [uncultured Microbacterium sp.]